MGNFFHKLFSENIVEEWTLALDWIFDDNKFSKDNNWNRGYTGSFTSKVKKLKYLSNDEKRVKYGKINYTDLDKKIKENKNKCYPYLIFNGQNCFAKDLIRHIRNGIAHGHSSISKVRDELYIEIMDYKSDSLKLQTAYIYIPLSYILEFNRIYNNINKSIMNTKPKDRKATQKYKRKVGED